MPMLTIEEKWSALFHDGIESERQVDPETAGQALMLFSWMVAKYKRFNGANGYADDEELLREAEVVLAALEGRSRSTEPGQNWPFQILKRWHSRKPFHEALGREIRESSWGSFWAIARRDFPSGRYAPK